MTQKTFNFITITETPTEVSIVNNVLNEEIFSFSRSNFYALSEFTYNNTFRFISDLEEMNFRFSSTIKQFFNGKIGLISYNLKTKALLNEIGARFNKYFIAEDMPMVASIISQIQNTSRQDDAVYNYFNNNVLSFIEKKNKQNLYFASVKRKSFDECLTNHISKAI